MMSFMTADICDEHGDSVRVMELGLSSYGGVSGFYGEIVTIRIDEDNSDLIPILRDTDGTGKVAVVDVSGSYCAVVGDNLMAFARDNGWAGIVVHGYVRDTKITKTIPVGLYALGTCPRKSPKKAKGELGIDLRFGGLDIIEGEYIYADEDGVIVSRYAIELVFV